MALFWHKNIKVLPLITYSFVESFYKINCLVASTSNKAYKFFMEGYIHEFEGIFTSLHCLSVSVQRNVYIFAFFMLHLMQLPTLLISVLFVPSAFDRNEGMTNLMTLG